MEGAQGAFNEPQAAIAAEECAEPVQARVLWEGNASSLWPYAFSVSSTRSGVNGMWRSRLPVSLKNAFEIAPAMNGLPISPRPVGRVSTSTNCDVHLLRHVRHAHQVVVVEVRLLHDAVLHA